MTHAYRTKEERPKANPCLSCRGHFPDCVHACELLDMWDADQFKREQEKLENAATR